MLQFTDGFFDLVNRVLSGWPIFSERKRYYQLILMITLFIFPLMGSSCAQPTIIPGSTDIKVIISSNSFSPTLWRVPGGSEISLVITNNDPVTHHWTLLRDPLTPPYSSDDQEKILYQITIPPQSSRTGTFTTPLAPGEYDVIGDPLLITTGMTGILLVVENK
jgi:hypothetical protein